MKIEVTTEIDVTDISNAIYAMPKSWQIDVLTELLKAVDTETSRRTIDRFTEEWL